MCRYGFLFLKSISASVQVARCAKEVYIYTHIHIYTYHVCIVFQIGGTSPPAQSLNTLL